ncbi:MAG: MFS transporter [Planctomycetes bacterium]|nr:MFS transporter [Planctomycetota bacterium]
MGTSAAARQAARMDGMAENPHAAGTMGDDTTDLDPIPPPAGTTTAALDDAGRESRNTFWIECYQIAVRVGWIFKTETIIMPAVLDAVVDSGFLRGLLPVLNRGGQSVPPLLVAGAVARRPRKKWSLVATSLGMAACFAVLAVAWRPLQAARPDLLALLFLVVYATFSAVIGVNQLVFAALQGKLVSPGHRGRAMVVSVAVGSVLAIAAAIALLGPWLAEGDGFPKIFAATAAFFAVAAVAPVFLDEPADSPGSTPGSSRGSLGHRCAAGVAAWRETVAGDPVLVRLAAVAACFSAVLMMFPHYQAFARDRLGSGAGSLLAWVCTQNAATGLASLVAGPVSDRRGTRIVLVWLVALSAVTPLVVTALSLLPHATAVTWFWIVYVPLGLNPLSLKLLTNYALELAPAAAEHPRYVSIVGAALAAPFLLSPLVGLAVDGIGFRPVFVLGALVILAGAVIAAGLPEPRRARRRH